MDTYYYLKKASLRLFTNLEKIQEFYSPGKIQVLTTIMNELNFFIDQKMKFIIKANIYD